MEAPEIIITDFAKFDRPAQLHIVFQALSKYVSEKGAFPKSRSKVRPRHFEFQPYILRCLIIFMADIFLCPF